VSVCRAAGVGKERAVLESELLKQATACGTVSYRRRCSALIPAGSIPGPLRQLRLLRQMVGAASWEPRVTRLLQDKIAARAFTSTPHGDWEGKAYDGKNCEAPRRNAASGLQAAAMARPIGIGTGGIGYAAADGSPVVALSGASVAVTRLYGGTGRRRVRLPSPHWATYDDDGPYTLIAACQMVGVLTG